MKTRIIVSVVLLPFFFAVLFFLPPFVLAIIVSLITAIAAYELINATGFKNYKRVLVYTIIAAALVPGAVYLSSLPALTQSSTNSSLSILTLITLLTAIFFFLMCLLVIELVLTFKTEKQLKLRHILISLAGGMVIPYMLSALISLKAMPEGHLLVLLPIIAAFLTDSGAYFTGKAIGKRQAFPKISPKKTVEGCIGGLIIGIAGMLIYGLILANTTGLIIKYPLLIVYGVIGAVITELGDLAFSLIKRKCGIKDYGKLIPGHGGVLDRFDSMTFTAPAMYLLVLILPAIIN